MAEAKPKSKKVNYANARQEARKLVFHHRRTLIIGLVIMFVGRLLGLIMPAMPKLLGDKVLAPHRPDLLLPLALIVAVAMLIKAALDFTLSQIVSVAAQRAIADMRAEMQHHVLRLPVS